MSGSKRLTWKRHLVTRLLLLKLCFLFASSRLQGVSFFLFLFLFFFKKKAALLRYNSHTMKFSFYDLNMYLLKCTVQGFSTFTELCLHHPLVPEHFSTTKETACRESHAPAPSPHWPSPHLCGSPCALDFSYKRSLAAYSLWCLARFT